MNRANIYGLLLLLIPSAILFGPALIREQSFAYRDSARFYHRQFEWNRAQWTAGQIPLWNAQENLGEPVVAEASSSVFYPLQVIFLVPGFSFTTAFVIYAAIHVYLASVGTFFLARSLNCGFWPAIFGGVSYSLGGSLIFQTCNIIFLVGASWLPFCLWRSLQLTRSPSLSTAAQLAIFLALPILGGDPQTTYHVGIIAGLWMLVKQVSGERTGLLAHTNSSDHSRVRTVVQYHLLAATLTVGLAAIQILPAWHAAQSSSRAYAQRARTVWELPSQSELSLQGLYGHPVSGTHHDHIYQFSQGPWTFAELCWPHVSGQIQPQHSRWSESIPAASRTWTPSVYCGVIALSLFLAGLWRRSSCVDVRWLKICFWIFALGSLGWFGLGWVYHEFCYGCFGTEPAEHSLGAPTGGVYWFFVVFLPGYVNFRYPAKLFVVASLFLCLVAARELETLLSKNQLKQLRRSILLIASFTAIVLVSLWLGSIPISRWFEKIAQATSSEFGPFEPQSAWSSILFSMTHSLLVCGLAALILNQAIRAKTKVCVLTLLATVDVLIANHSLILMADSKHWEAENQVVGHLQAAATGDHSSTTKFARLYRTDPMTWSAAQHWFGRSSNDRLGEIVDFENQTLMSKHHLRSQGDLRVGLVESFRSIENSRFASLLAILKGRPGISTQDSFDVQLAPNPIALGVLSCDYLLIPAWGQPSVPAESLLAKTGEYLLIRNPYFRDRFRIAEDVQQTGVINDLLDWIQHEESRRLLQAFFSIGEEPPRPIVEVADGQDLQLATIAANSSNRDTSVQVTFESSTRIDLSIQSHGGLLVIADTYDEDWLAFRVAEDQTTSRLPIYRTNFVMRGVPLEPGETTIRLVYRPRWVIRGAISSGLSGALLMILIAWPILTRKRRPIEAS